MLRFSKILGKLVVKYVSTNLGYPVKKKKKKKKKKISEDSSNDAYATFCVFFLWIFFIKAYAVGTHLNCIDKSMQFEWVPTTYALIKK